MLNDGQDGQGGGRRRRHARRNLEPKLPMLPYFGPTSSRAAARRRGSPSPTGTTAPTGPEAADAAWGVDRRRRRRRRRRAAWRQHAGRGRRARTHASSSRTDAERRRVRLVLGAVRRGAQGAHEARPTRAAGTARAPRAAGAARAPRAAAAPRAARRSAPSAATARPWCAWASTAQRDAGGSIFCCLRRWATPHVTSDPAPSGAERSSAPAGAAGRQYHGLRVTRAAVNGAAARRHCGLRVCVCVKS